MPHPGIVCLFATLESADSALYKLSVPFIVVCCSRDEIRMLRKYTKKKNSLSELALPKAAP